MREELTWALIVVLSIVEIGLLFLAVSAVPTLYARLKEGSCYSAFCIVLSLIVLLFCIDSIGLGIYEVYKGTRP